MTGYACKACGAPANVDASGVKRSCGCNTTVLATMDAVATGDGELEESNPTKKLLKAFHELGLHILKALRARVQ